MTQIQAVFYLGEVLLLLAAADAVAGGLARLEISQTALDLLKTIHSAGTKHRTLPGLRPYLDLAAVPTVDGGA